MKGVLSTFCRAILLMLIASAVSISQAKSSYPVLAWSGGFVPFEYLSPQASIERRMQYYDGRKANMGSTPDAACSNAYIANEKFLFNSTVDPASFATLINPQDNGYGCQIKSGEIVVEVIPGESGFIYAICTSPALEILQIDLEAQGGDALNNWSREYRRGLPASYAGIPRNGFDSLRNTCQCPTGSKLHPNQEYCVKMPDIVIGFFNGVSNTRQAALSSKKRLEIEYGGKIQRHAPPIRAVLQPNCQCLGRRG